MHTLDINSSNVPAFLIKLWKLVEDPSCDDLIAWSDSGISFIIKDQARFARELLPQYFKHNNMASFVRQLNMYGFRKVMNYEKSGLRNENNEMEFQHAFFIKEQSELLELIKRKIPNTRVVAETHVKSNPKDILTDLTSIRDKQESMDNMLMKMKHENELLWKELTNMRQKHKQQEQVIEKVIHFLVQVLRNQPVGVGIQRKMPRMLHDSPGSKSSTSQIATLEIVNQKNPDCIIVQDKNSCGPVIHEVTDVDMEEPISSSVQSPIISVKSPASKSSTKSPAPNIVVFSPADRSSNSKNNKSDESEHLVNECPLSASSLNSPIDSSVAMEPLGILDPIQSRTPVENEDTEGDDSVLGIPLEYITANDVVSSMNLVPTHNVISIPEDNIVSNVISIPEGTEISKVISIPIGSNISDIIAVTDNNSIKDTITSTTVTSNMNSVCDATVVNSADKSSDPVTIPDFYDLQPDSVINVKSPLNSSLINHTYVDPLMSDSLQTPKIPLAEDLGLTDFAVEEEKKQNDSNKEISLSSPVNITQREHDYPATVSNSSSSLANNSTLTKNTLSNHLLTVEEQLNRLQDHIATNTWDVDADKLLGLFSSDGMVSNDAFVSQLTDGITIKKEPDDILGNELIQFTPQLLEVELDELRSPFLNQLDPEILNQDEISATGTSDKNDSIKEQDSLSSGFSLSENVDNHPNKRRKIMKPPKTKSKRRLK